MDRGKRINDSVDAGFMRMVYEFMDKHNDVLSALAKEDGRNSLEIEQIAS